MAITLNGTTGITTPDVNSDGLTVDSTTLVVDDTNNRVGIGTSSPSQVLEVGNTATSNTYIQVSAANNTASGIKFRSDGSLATGWDIGYEGNGNYLFFKHDVSGTVTERARIDSSGNLLVGTTSAGVANTLSTTIETSGANNSRITVNHSSTAGSSNDSNYMQFGYGGNLIGRIVQASTTSVSYTTTSDYRLKENVVGVTGASARVQQLNPVRFNFIADPDRTVDGFLAHEVQDVVPEAISGAKDATEMVDVHDEDGNVTGQEERPVYQGIDQSKLVPLLTAALQEALTKIDSLETRIAALEAA